MKFLKKLLLIIFTLFAIGFFALSIYYFSVTSNVRLQPEKLASNSAHIQIYDKDGVLLPCANSQFNSATYQQFPATLIQAFLSTEDRRFFSHRGFDVKRMAKALLKNVSSMSIKEGASTISQQLIKNTHLTGEKTIKRKLQEIKLTKQLEKQYSKEDILTKYLNTIYFGHNVFGVSEAAQFYFDCPVEELSIDQCAILAGIVRSPNNYSPFKNPQKCRDRRNLVLSFMKSEGYIDENVYSQAKSAPLPEQKASQFKDGSYCQFVYNEVEKIFEEKGLKIGGNLQVYTYLDQSLQNQLSTALSVAESNKSGGILDNETGGYVAFYSDVGNIKRSPASTLKPLAVYAPALQENLITIASPILDEAVDFGGYQPKNYDGKFHGYVSVRESLQKSLNIPAVKILNSLGVKKAKTYLEKMHLSIEQQDEHLALALGGTTNGFSLSEILSAYSVFPNQGFFNEGHFIQRIERDGVTIYSHQNNTQKVFDQATAYLLTDVLQGASKTGTAKKLKHLPFPIAAKTGTAGTQEKNTDAYAVAYTTGYTTAVWLGNADNAPITYTGGGLPCMILCEIYEYLYDNTSKEKFADFPIPAKVEEVKLDKLAYENKHVLVLADPQSPPEFTFTELFEKQSVPTQISQTFSNPTIPAPAISYSGGKVIITFDKNTPTIYRYKIEKIADKKRTTLYFGETVQHFVDEELQLGKNYIYTITPYFNNTQGDTITLPSITTKAESKQTIIPPEIVEKPWWKY